MAEEDTGPPILSLLEGGGADPADVASDDEGIDCGQEFFLPVSGFVWYFAEEVDVINHPAFQRLAQINQLGQAYYVFRGGTHKRIEHVMGAVSVADRMITAINKNAERARSETDRCAPLNEFEIRFVRLGALLHDIGHIASGHTLEDELGLFDQHDRDERLNLVFKKSDWSSEGTPQTLEELVNERYARFVPPSLASQGLTATDIVRLIIRKRPKAKSEDGKEYYDEKRDPLFRDRQKAFWKSSEIRANICENMVGNTICADLLDYIYRDWYHVGKVFPPEDRIFQYMEIRNPDPNKYAVDAPDSERRSPDDFFVLSLGNKEGDAPKIRTDGVSAILNLLENRYQLAETVLYHRTKLAASAMLDRGLYETWGPRGAAGKQIKPEAILSLSDEQLIDYAIQESKGKSRAADRLLQGLRHRRLHRVLVSVQHSSHGSKRGASLINLLSSEGEGAKVRVEIARAIEHDFELPEGSVVVGYSSVKPKIAEVRIRVDQTIMKFNEYEILQSDESGLSGGHLQAQINRFKDMRRVDFFLAKDVWEHLKKNDPALLNDIVDLVNGAFIQPDGPAAAQRHVARIANSYVMRENSKKRNSIELVDPGDVKILAARSDAVTAGKLYPNGVIALKSYLKRHTNEPK